MPLSDSIITRITGFELEPGNFSNNTPNLPVVIAIQAESNDANQTGLDPFQATNAAQVAAVTGWGSPCWQAAKILFPTNKAMRLEFYREIQPV